MLIFVQTALVIALVVVPMMNKNAKKPDREYQWIKSN
jgi:hypothetical protein